jgi:hypothetical protein
MKLTGKPGTGDPYAGFDEAGAGNGQIPSTAPVLDPTDEGELEIELRLLRQFPTLPTTTTEPGLASDRKLTLAEFVHFALTANTLDNIHAFLVFFQNLMSLQIQRRRE